MSTAVVSVPVSDYKPCNQSSDCRTQTFKCCPAVASTVSPAVTINVCVSPLQKTVPAGISFTVTTGVSSSTVDFTGATYACTSTSATKLMVAGAAVSASAIMLF